MKTMRKTLCLCLLAILLCGCGKAQDGTNDTTLSGGTEPAVSQTTTAAETDIRQAFGEWFLAPIDLTDHLKPIEVPPQYETWVLKTPTQVTETRGALEFTVDFFKDTYRFGEGLQVRVTVKNVSQSDAEFSYYSYGSEILRGETPVVLFPVPFHSRYNNDFKAEYVKKAILEPQKTLTYEYLFYIQSEDFSETGTYTWHFNQNLEPPLKVDLEVVAEGT